MKRMIVLMALAASACQTNTPVSRADCISSFDSHCSNNGQVVTNGGALGGHGDALLAGAVAGAAGYAAGRMHRDRRDYNHGYDRRPVIVHRTVVVQQPRQYAAPARASSPVSASPARRTMFGSARRK